MVGRVPSRDETWLYEVAEAARELAYVPYSKFRVGAALLTTAMGPLSAHPSPVSAANVENASYGLAICAERSAVVRAMAEGLCPEAVEHSRAVADELPERASAACITALAVAGERADTVSPCGACRQVLHELAAPGAIIVMTLSGRVRVLELATLLPAPFEL